MADKLILNANMVCKSSGFKPQKCAVEKVIEVSDEEFQHFIEAPTLRNYYLPQYKNLMGFYDDTHHGVLFVNEENGDGLLVNSEGADYARYSQYIPNAREIIQRHEQTAALDALKNHMDSCIDKWLEKCEGESKFDIPLTDLISGIDLGEILTEYAAERLSADPRIGDCELTPNFLEVAKREFVETRLYCPLTFTMDSDDGSEYPEEVCSANYIYYDDEINETIRQSLSDDEEERKYGLNAYTHSEHLAKKVHSVFPSVETRNGDLFGVFTIKSYGELDRAELMEITQEIIGQAADGWGEFYEQHPVTLGDDEVYISFWNSDDCYFLKPESEVFPEQKFDQSMGGI